MKFIQYSSGSSGNFYEVMANNGERLLIECGIAWPKMLKFLDYNLKGVRGCLISHEHL